jgi:hypothetical protein
MATDTTINANLVLKSTETDLKDEYIDETFWDSLAVDSALETDYDGPAPDSIMVRKTKQLKLGAKYIEFGISKELDGEGRFNGATLSGHEEPIDSEDNAVYFTDARHGVPFPLKGLESHYLEAFNLMQKRQRALSIWNGRLSESWAWQGLLKGCPDKVNLAHTTASPQSWHPSIYTIDSTTGLTKITWSATAATYEQNIDTAITAQQAGDNFSATIAWLAEVKAADLHLRKVPITHEKNSYRVWIWAYPRAARVRIKTALKDYYMYGDVRGPNNNVIHGEKFKFGQFLFVEAAYIPYILPNGDNTVTYQDAWGYSATDGKRADRRTATKGLIHAILGAEALCLAEPEGLQYDFERKDYKAKEGIGTYRLFGTRRNETFDNRTSVTSVTNQSSLLLVENNG